MRTLLKELLSQYPDATAALVVGLGLAAALTIGSHDIPQAVGLAGWIAMSACVTYSFWRTQGV